MEASLHTIGEKARLLSGYMTGIQCLNFKYHMMGAGTGSLRVNQISKKTSRPRVVWARIGDQGENWEEARFNLFGDFYRVRFMLLLSELTVKIFFFVPRLLSW